MEFYVRNQSFEIVGIIDKYSSMIWTTRYNGAGDFELYFPASDSILAVIKEDYIVTRNDVETAMIIKTIKIHTDEEAGDYITISGVSLESILNQRLVWNQTTLNGRVEDCINQLVVTNCISPIDSNRIIPNLQLGEYQGFSSQLNAQYDGENLLSVISQICEAFSLGFKIIIKNQRLVFQLYKGADRSYNQSVNPWVVFSGDFDNLLQSDYVFDAQNYKNVALVGGEGEGIFKKYVSYSYGTSEGLARHETYVDASNVSSNNGDISQAEYLTLLLSKGLETLLNAKINETLEGSVNSGSYKYGVDYNLGDIVQITAKHGLTATPRITAITENEDETGYKIYPTFTVWEVN